MCLKAGVDAQAVRSTLRGQRFGVRWLEVEGQPITRPFVPGLRAQDVQHRLRNYPRAVAAGFDAASHVEMLREMGVESAYLFPTVGMWLFAMDDMDPKLAAALVRAYNGWLRDFCAHEPDFLRPVGAVCRHDPEAMVDEVRRIASWGWTAVVTRPNPVRGRTLSDPTYEPFWTECERLGISVALHEGYRARLPVAGLERFRSNFAEACLSHPIEQMLALLSLIEGGVLERHPQLRVGIIEAGCGWLPYWLWRLDTRYEHGGWEVAEHVRMKPSDYFRRQCFISCEASEPGLEDVVRMLGEGVLLYGSDYPHSDHGPYVRRDAERLAERLSAPVARRILVDNPERFYGARAARAARGSSAC